MEINYCDSNPCQNGAMCINKMDGFECVCLAEYDGFLCQHDRDSCTFSPCGMNGNCIDTLTEYMCDCHIGYTGRLGNKMLIKTRPLNFFLLFLKNYLI